MVAIMKFILLRIVKNWPYKWCAWNK